MSDSGPADGGWRDRGEGVLARLVAASAGERILISIAALVLSILVGAVIVLLSGWAATCGDPFLTIPGMGGLCYNPVLVYFYLFQGAFGGLFALALTLKETTLLIFTGLAVAVAFRAGMFNIGTQGQLVLGALATAVTVLAVAPMVPGGIVGGLLLLPLGLLAGAVVGGLYGALPGALKAYADANEVITTIMLNFVATGIAFVLVSEVFKDPNSQSVETAALPGYATFQPVLPLFAGSDFSLLALAGGLALVAGLSYLLGDTSFGYDLRTSGVQPEAAEYGGVDAKRTMVASMALSGAIAGLGGAVFVMMVLSRWRTGIPALGFDGITVSILAGNNPLGVVPAALLFGVLKSGSLALEFATGIPKQLVGVLRGLVILFVAMPEFFRMLGRRWGIGERRAAVTDGGTAGGEADE